MISNMNGPHIFSRIKSKWAQLSFFEIFQRETTLVTSYLLPRAIKPYRMGSTLVREEFAPIGANSFL